MSAEEDLYLNQSDAEALFFPDGILGNADEIDFESFGDASGLDVRFFFSFLSWFPSLSVTSAVSRCVTSLRNCRSSTRRSSCDFTLVFSLYRLKVYTIVEGTRISSL